MPVFLGLLITIVLLFASGFAKSLIRGGKLVPADFNFGPQASLTALLFAIDIAVSNKAGTQSAIQSTGVIGTAALSLVAALKLSQLHGDWSSEAGGQQVRAWAAWSGSNLFGLLCVFLVVMLKYPV